MTNKENASKRYAITYYGSISNVSRTNDDRMNVTWTNGVTMNVISANVALTNTIRVKAAWKNVNITIIVKIGVAWSNVIWIIV